MEEEENLRGNSEETVTVLCHRRVGILPTLTSYFCQVKEEESEISRRNHCSQRDRSFTCSEMVFLFRRRRTNRR